MTARAEAVSAETLARVEREEREALAAPPGAEGARRAVEEHAGKYADKYEADAARLEAAAAKARAHGAWWRRIAHAAAPMHLVHDEPDHTEVAG